MLNAVLTGVVVLLGIWALAAMIVTAAGGSLHDLMPYLVLALAAGPAAAGWDYAHGEDDPPHSAGVAQPLDPRWLMAGAVLLASTLVLGQYGWVGWGGAVIAVIWLIRPTRPVLIGLGAVIGGAALAVVITRDHRRLYRQYAETVDQFHPVAHWILLWMLVLALVWVVLPRSEKRVSSPSVKPWLENAVIFASMAAAMGATLWSNRPDADDYYYLEMCYRLREGLDQSIFQLLRFGLETSPSNGVYIWHPYEMLVAALSQGFHLKILDVCYLLLPAISAALTVAAWSLCARIFLPNHAVWVVPVCLVLVLSWGEIHRAPGNFAFVRLFQGKSQLASLGVPLAFWFGWRWAQRRGLRSLAVMLCAMAASLAMTHVGAVTAPLAAALGAWTGWKPDPRQRDLLGLAVVGCLFPWLVVLSADYLLYHRWLLPRSIPAEEALVFAFPPDFRALLGFAALPLLPALLPSPQRQMALRLVAFALLAILNPLGIEALSHLMWSVQWRILWALPLAPLLALFLVAVAQAERALWTWPVVAGLALAAFVLCAPTSLSTANGTQFGQLGYKLPADRVAYYLNRDAALP